MARTPGGARRSLGRFTVGLDSRRGSLEGRGIDRMNCCERVHKGSKFLEIFGEDSYELDTVADQRIVSDHLRDDKQRALELQFEFQVRTDGEREHGLHVAAAQAEVGGGTADGSVAAFDVNFERNLRLKSRVLALLRIIHELASIDGGA